MRKLTVLICCILACISVDAQTTFYDCLPEFTITGDIEACAGTSAVYTLPEENYTSIDWIVNGESVSSANSLDWSFLTESTTTIEVEAFTELCAYTHSIEVMVHPTPSFDVTVWGTSISTFPAQESYIWYFEDQLIAEATSSQYNATESGNYAVVGFNEFGCYQNSSINFELCPPIPTIEGNTYFCGSQFQSLYTSTEYPNMDWYLDDQYFGFGVEFFGGINTPGTHTITLSVGNDLCMTDNEIEVVASGLPQISLSDGVISTDFIGEFYQWYLNDNPIEGATTNAVNVSGAGFYTVLVTVGDECAVESDNIFIPLTVAESIETPIQPFPNPFADQLQLNLPATFILPGSVRIMNATGQLIFQTTITSTQQMLQLDAFASGMYLIEVIDERGQISVIKAEKE